MILWLSTIYLRYHYFVDVVAGFALSAVGLALAEAPKERRAGAPALWHH